LTFFSETKRSKPFCCFYKHWDGYPTGLGAKIKAFGYKIALVDGISGDETNLADGMGCFATQLIAHLKGASPGPGDIYMESPIKGMDRGREYEYHLWDASGLARGKKGLGASSPVGITVYSNRHHTPLYDGLLRDFNPEAAEKALRQLDGEEDGTDLLPSP
jgi:hypothetical protein